MNNGFSWQARRWLLLPVLFIVLILLAFAYTLQNVTTFSRESSAAEVVKGQRLLREGYVASILLAANGQTSESRRMMAQTRTHLERLMQASLPAEKSTPFSFLTPRSLYRQKLYEALQEKKVLLVHLEKQCETLLSLTPETPAYQQTLRAIIQTNHALSVPDNDLPSLYLTESRQRWRGLIFVNVALMVLALSIWLWLTLVQRKAEKGFWEEQERFRQVFDVAPIGKVLSSPDGRWFKVNQSLCQLLGYTEQELVGQTFESLTYPEDYQAEVPFRTRLLTGEIPNYRMTMRYVHKHGDTVWTWSTVAASHDEEGSIRYLVAQLVDITEQRRMMDAVQASELKYRSVVETATEGIIVGGMEGYILSTNSQACRMFGYEPGELEHQLLTCLMPERFRPSHQLGLKHLAETGLLKWGGKVLELVGLRQDGTEFPLELCLSVWRDAQGVMFCTAIIRDITERKQAERERELLLQSNKDLEEFAIISSHDLQEPLRKIVFYAERFSSQTTGLLDEASSETLRKILDATRRMQTLLSDLLAYSRILSRPGRFQWVSLHDVLNEVFANLNERINEVGAVVEVGKLPELEADTSQMVLLFTNLVDNALKYRRDGVSSQIRIYGKVQESSSASPLMAQIRVEDNGIGFQEKYLDRIFKVFQRLHGQGRYSGTGMGLAICRRIVERHRGSITATSKPGVGSTFIVTLPMHQLAIAS